MSEIILFKGQTVAPAFRHLTNMKTLGSGIVAGGFPVVNYRGKVWSLRTQGNNYPFVREDDGSPLTYLDVIIVGVSEFVSKIYYPPGEWDEDSSGAPVCASIKGDVPDPGVPEPQAKSCAMCPNNQWATQPNGRRGKACQDHKRLAVLLMPKVTAKMLGSPLTEPAYLKVPPGSLVPLKRYGDQLAHQGFPPAAVITRISFAPPPKLFEMKFDGKQVLSDKEAPLVLPLIDDPRTLRITGETPEIHEVAPAKAAVPKEEPIETGLVDAFGGQQEVIPPKAAAPGNGSPAEAPRRGRGRPPKAAAQTIEHEASAPDPKAPMFDEDSTDLDHEVADLLSRKVSDMMT